MELKCPTPQDVNNNPIIKKWGEYIKKQVEKYDEDLKFKLFAGDAHVYIVVPVPKLVPSTFVPVIFIADLDILFYFIINTYFFLVLYIIFVNLTTPFQFTVSPVSP